MVLVGQLLAAAILLGAGRHRPPQPPEAPAAAPLVVGDGRVVRLISLGGTRTDELLTRIEAQIGGAVAAQYLS